MLFRYLDRLETRKRPHARVPRRMIETGALAEALSGAQSRQRLIRSRLRIDRRLSAHDQPGCVRRVSLAEDHRARVEGDGSLRVDGAERAQQAEDFGAF